LGFLPLAFEGPPSPQGSGAGFGPPWVFYFPGTRHIWRAVPYPPPGEAPDGRPATPYRTVLIILKLCGLIFVCWQVWRDNKQEIAVPMNEGCHDVAVAMNNGCHGVGLRKQHLGYHNSWDCRCFILLVWCWVLKLAAHTVTPLDVTTVARCCRQTQYVLHPAECHQQRYKHHSDSGQQVSSITDNILTVTAV
jgi:hypothetical protein